MTENRDKFRTFCPEVLNIEHADEKEEESQDLEEKNASYDAALNEEEKPATDGKQKKQVKIY